MRQEGLYWIKVKYGGSEHTEWEIAKWDGRQQWYIIGDEHPIDNNTIIYINENRIYPRWSHDKKEND